MNRLSKTVCISLLALGTSMLTAGKALALNLANPNFSGFVDLDNGGLAISADGIGSTGSTGTGTFNSFLTLLDNEPAVQGYNFDTAIIDNTDPLNEAAKAGGSSRTRLLRLNEVLVNVAGDSFVQIALDINESDDEITLDVLELFLSSDNDRYLYTSGSPSTLGQVDTTLPLQPQTGSLINPFYSNLTDLIIPESGSGSGRADAFFLLPIDPSLVNGDGSNQFIYTYARLTGESAGFEEFAVDGTVSFNQIPTPAMLPGLVGIGMAAFRKRKNEADA